ncbi:MAG TPA: hypothetical protein VEH82_01025 [Acidimicrobiales bacterium]|nr:hypothetical protein [Acidimicrobiales bacterium]
MADLRSDGDQLVLQVSACQKAEGFHGDIRVPLSAVTAVRVVRNPRSEWRGTRSPGTGWPGVVVGRS